ncbi:MAG: hypothetical protein AAF337_11865 [Pseudomonadota bacterium]
MRAVLFGAIAAICGFGTAHADCTQSEAVAKMQAILASPEYSALISGAGQTAPPSKQRETAKRLFRQYGGDAGSAVANSMQTKDNEKALAEAQASVSSVIAFNQTLNEAGGALGQGDPGKACALYDRLLIGLGVE